MSARYFFTEEWEVPASPDRVREVVTDPAGYPRWWPQVRSVEPVGEEAARVRCRSTLPYTLDLVLHAVSRELPVLEVALSGDLEGSARWTVRAVPGGSRMLFEQEVVARGLLVPASLLLRPLLSWNHARMMAGCRDGLRRRLAPTDRTD